MSSGPRRSLRLRNVNLPEDESEEPEIQVKAVAPKRRAAASAAQTKNAAAPKSPKKKRTRGEKKEVKDEEMDDDDENREEEKEEEEAAQSDEEMGEVTAPDPDESDGKVKKEEQETAYTSSRPKRRCSVAAAAAFRKIASADGPSDADDDFNVVKEIAERKKITKKEKESATTSKSTVKNGVKNADANKKPPARNQKGRGVVKYDDTTSEEEEEEKPKKKETKKSAAKSSKEPKIQRPPSLDRPQSQQVKLLLDRKYDVDRDEMLAWEKRASAMSKEYRKLESDSYSSSGRQKEIMDRVWKFVERCLKDRIHEMGDQESIKLCAILHGEFDEWERKKKMTVTQRIKETVDKEMKAQEEEENSDNGEDDEWEAMETVDGEGDVKTMQVVVEKEGKMDWKCRWLKQEVNKAMRVRHENLHKTHLLSYMSHLRHLAAMALSQTSKQGEVPMAAIALSMVPSDGKKTKKERMELIEWWWKEFELFEEAEEEEERSEEERLSERMMERRFTNHKDAAIMFFSLASAAGFTVRIVCRCQVMTKKVPEAPDAKKKAEVKEPTKKRNGVSEQSRDYPIVEYWVEIWDEGTDSWTPIDVIRPQSPLKEEDEEDEEESRLQYAEPLNSCMAKGGQVLYILAIDNEFAIRDVSARYIHSQNFVAKEFRNRRAKQEWLNELWEMETWRAHSIRACKEDDEWLSSMKVDLPKLVGQYKDHPLYVLDKDVLKMQRIFPYNAKPVGELRGYKIYSRKFLRPTNTAKWYEKMGRQVRDDEPPVGEKKLTNPMTGESVMQGLFGYWQTDPWDAGEVIDGRVPRNEFDNIYMYQPKEMCPKGGIYIVPEGLQKVALELGKDCVPAVIGWTYKGGNIVPIIQGAVFAKEDIPELVAAWKECEKRWKEEEKKVRSERSLGNWKKLIKGMLRLAAMRKEFEPMENRKKKGTTMEDETVRAEEAAAWPQQRYGGDLFE